MTLPPDCALHLFGDLSRLTADGEPPGSLTLAPTLGRRPGMAPYVLPDLGLLQQASSLSLDGGPMGQAISLQGIERFPALTQLMLWGRFADWDALLRLPHLRALEIRFTPDLQGLPPLDSWPLLDRFIAYNVDEAAGKRLRAQMKARGQQRAWTSHASVSQLRKPEWWQREYGRPFRAGAAVRPRRRTRPMMRRGTHSTARRMSRRRRRRSRPSPRISTR